ncbi:MAG TPA: class I SAM-dependent methyltransferase [Egibacteraceae bacterium]
MASTAAQRHQHLPGLGRPWLTPLYDLASWVFGVGALHQRVLDDARIGPGDRVLEIGCGTGNLALRAARLQPRAAVTGLDPDPAALAIARRKARRRRVSATFDQGVAEDLPYADGAFDVVLSSLMLHHIDAESRLQVLREARRVLVPGGQLVLADISGPPAEPRGLLARLHPGPRARDGLGEDLPALLGDAGFVQQAPVRHTTPRMGLPIAVHRAVATS